ncbi:uncharacterized protein LOC130718195 [Lotus japonicus]|uniref:uncharacterized protein LOC130718195 n=1 Tax=Lotus japonicus TaxID=34305 RepID=UPI0025829046|nr:uncharacterized protein LOC130718195 [Lotus japonicus]
MGKKPQKMKELSAEILAEASSAAIDETGEHQQQQQQSQPQPQATRKRGRPRKISVKMDKAQTIEEPEANTEAQSKESSMEKGVVNKEEKQEGSSSACIMRIAKQEGVSEEMKLPRSRARRKSKPRKSS